MPVYIHHKNDLNKNEFLNYNFRTLHQLIHLLLKTYANKGSIHSENIISAEGGRDLGLSVIACKTLLYTRKLVNH